MKNYSQNIGGWTLGGLLCVLILFTGSAGATDFVSFNGKFVITYPDNWVQIDYQSADYHLSQAGADLDYEAMFALEDTLPFYNGPYLILTVDTIGYLTPPQVDSTLEEIAESFGRKLAEVPSDKLILEPREDVLGYDLQTRTAAIVSKVEGAPESQKKNLLVMKFYEEGIANFYFYTPDSLFEVYLPVFQQMVASLSTENLEVALTSEPVKIAKPKSNQVWKEWYYVPVIGGILIILLVVSRWKRKTKA